mmetsp:Transcript_28500/g.43032  ORF Transcript_28500/g.43032 Transcript_28500/m.43032 type:complete len:201 (+) Transcript_28500:70-672(+)
MKTAAILLSTLSVASAFAPSQNAASSCALNAAVPRETVLSEPDTTEFGKIWDPLGLAEMGSDETIAWFRHSEVKHGRVAMAACLGWYLNAGGVHPAFNSALSNDPLKAMVELPAVGWVQFVLGCGAIEWLGQQIKERPGYNPGDLLGAAYWVDNSDEGWVQYQNKELNNGRLAMLAITGMIYQDVFTGEYGDMMYRQLVR